MAQLFLGILVKNDVVEGTKVPAGLEKVSADADDLIVFCNDRSDIDMTFSLLDKVNDISGSQLIQSKTKILC